MEVGHGHLLWCEPKDYQSFWLSKVFLSQAAIDKLDDTELNGRRIRLIPERGWGFLYLPSFWWCTVSSQLTCVAISNWPLFSTDYVLVIYRRSPSRRRSRSRSGGRKARSVSRLISLALLLKNWHVETNLIIAVENSWLHIDYFRSRSPRKSRSGSRLHTRSRSKGSSSPSPRSLISYPVKKNSICSLDPLQGLKLSPPW